MKKAILCIILLCQIALLNGCTNKTTFNQLKNPVIYDKYESTLSNYYYEDNGSTSLSLYSFSPNPSPIVTVAMQSLFGTHHINIDEYNDKDNPYYYSYLKSLYEGKNFIDINMLTNKSNQYDFFLAFKVANTLKDEALLKQVSNTYMKFKPHADTYAEKVFESLNAYYMGNKKNTLTSLVEKKMEEYNFDIRFNPESLTDLDATLNYYSIFNLKINNKMKKIYDLLSTKDNQMFILTQPDILASQYIDSIMILNKSLHRNNLKDTFFASYLKENKTFYKPVIYDTNSLRNIALYINSLTFSSKRVSNSLYEQLVSITLSLKEKISTNDFVSQYYYSYICKRLGLNDSIEIQEETNTDKGNIKDDYYQYKLNDTLLPKKDITKEDILYKLMYLDICGDSSFIKESMNSIDILTYKDEQDFPALLNLYVCILSNNKLMKKSIKTKIITFIEQKKNVYGYAGLKENYDFEASSYYSNVLNILNGADDYGLR